jgi:hypothetical protein
MSNVGALPGRDRRGWLPEPGSAAGFGRRRDEALPETIALTIFFDNFFPRIKICRMIDSESRNRTETAMADVGDGAGIAGGERYSAPQEIAIRALRMLERLVAGSSLTEVAAGEGLTPQRARELVAQVVAQRGFDP